MADQSGITSEQPMQPAPGAAPSAHPGPQIPRGSQVAVVVSSGPAATVGAPVTAPDVLGKSQGDAASALQAVGLATQVLSDYNAGVPAGKVIGQYPDVGKISNVGSIAVLLVSKGAPPEANPTVSLPEVAGVAEADAVARVRGVGLTAQVFRDSSSTVPSGVVIGQVPNGRTPVRAAGGLPWWAWAAIAAAVVIVLVVGGALAMSRNQPAASNVAKVAVVATATTEATSATEATSTTGAATSTVPPATTPPATTATVPNVVGTPQSQAETNIRNAGFVPLVVKIVNSKMPAGSVVAQLPVGGTTLQKGAQVAIEVAEVSEPPAPTSVKVPNVVGMTQANAQSALVGVGLAPAFVTVASSAPNGSATAQDPVAAASVPPGTAVVVSISSGTPPPPTTVAVPNVVGMTHSAAQSALGNAKLSSHSVEEFSDKVAKGNVAAQSPAAGTKVAPGTSVAIVVSLGAKPTAPTKVTVPDLTGKTAEEATQQLADLELLTQEVVVPDPNAPEGEVLGQMPAEGTQVPQGSTVVIDVAGPAAAHH